MTGRHADQASRYVCPNVSWREGIAKIVARAYASAFASSLTTPRSTHRSSRRSGSKRAVQADWPIATKRASGRERQTISAASRNAWYPL